MEELITKQQPSPFARQGTSPNAFPAGQTGQGTIGIDLGDDLFANNQDAPINPTPQYIDAFASSPTGISNYAGLQYSSPPSRSGMYIGIGIIAMSGVIIAALFGTSFGDMFRHMLGDTAEVGVAPRVKAVDTTTRYDRPPSNPYRNLSNPLPEEQVLPPEEAPMKRRIWNADEENMWRGSMRHQYVYQHYKAVQEMRKEKLVGSEALLQETMRSDGKFWTRMAAAQALVEMGIPVTPSDIGKALENTQSELVVRYFQRFETRRNNNDIYLARQAIKVADEIGRVAALNVIHKRPDDEFHDLYMAAASFDPAPRVQRALERILEDQPIDPTRFNELKKDVIVASLSPNERTNERFQRVPGQAGATDLAAVPEQARPEKAMKAAAQPTETAAQPKESPDSAFDAVEFFEGQLGMDKNADFRPTEVITIGE